MASSMVRFKWWLQDRIMIHKHDIFLVLAFLSCVFIILYAFLLRYDDPDAADLSLEFDSDQDFINQALRDVQGNKEWRARPQDEAREREKAMFERVQEKLKHITTKKPRKKKKPGNQTGEAVNLEEELKLALKDDIVMKDAAVKDKAYWLNKYRDVFQGGFELDLNIEAPVNVGLQGGKARCSIYNHRAAMNDTYECVKLQVKHKPYICLYPSSSDVYLSQHIREEGIWEPHIVKLFSEYLNTDPSLGFIDIGANIGVYSLTAAILGHKVVAIEPYEENLKHLSQGIQRSRLEDNVIVLKNAVSDKRLKFIDLKLDPTNQGGVQVDDSNHNFGCYGDNCPPQAETILMDDILEVVNFKSAIIKIDIEGHEHRAFRESRQFFDRLYVPCIIMEWIKLKEYYGTEIDESEDKDMVQELVEYLTDQGYQAYSMVTRQKLDPGYWYAWPDDVLWKHLLARV